ncbi:DUF928 domain-containing protein [Nostoc sp. PCC 7107]|uniref:DUF928 domain-containing protein n=1 Tax=Nostoc sp. PCC 7107 TaxID=317936 RepID=UPI00029F2E52|nr:DUF928 domain-containing protein [Nostoc sp. PCC 7107]AFY41523.1 protein of unknown function DUF928 [Nostoc sp. PCC 7107]
MISPKLQTIGIILATTVGITSVLPVNTAVAREKIIFVPPVLGSPRRLIPAGTRAYEPPSGGEINVDILQTQPAPPVAPPTRGFGGNGGNIVIPPIQRTIPPNQDRNGASVPVPNQCLSGKIPLTALIPESQLGLTTLSNPALFFYVPQTSAPELELVVQNETEQEVYIQKYKPNNKAGIISIRLPVNSLAVNKQYKWKLSVICNPTDKSQNKVVAGLIQRVLPELQLVKKLQQATRQERTGLYAAAGIWHDALATVAQRRYLFPHNPEIVSDWEELLTTPDVRLNQQIVQQPLIPSPEVLPPKNKHKF